MNLVGIMFGIIFSANMTCYDVHALRLTLCQDILEKKGITALYENEGETFNQYNRCVTASLQLYTDCLQEDQRKFYSNTLEGN